MTNVRLCRRCLYDALTPAMRFDETGMCNYCRVHDEMDHSHPTGKAGKEYLHTLAEKIRQEGKGKEYDVIVGVSGGTDSSYLLYQTKELGLRPLAVHFDNTWNSATAVRNMSRVLDALHVPLQTLVVDNEEYNDMYRAFLLAGVPDIDSPTDMGLAATLYRAAEEHGISTIFEGHSFRTEGIAPVGWNYIDGQYIQSVVKRFGHFDEHRMRTFPNMHLRDFLRWILVKRIRKIRPLYWMDYQKSDAQKLLAEKFGWQWYGGHHLENTFTAFFHRLFMPQRFGRDLRILGYSALVRSGQMTREEGLALLATPMEPDPVLQALVQKRLGFSDEEWEAMMHGPLRSFRDFHTSKQTFERLRPLFWILMKCNLVPESFYRKYTSKKNI